MLRDGPILESGEAMRLARMRFASPRMDSSITMSTMPPVSFSIDPHDENDVGCCKGRFCRKRMVILADTILSKIESNKFHEIVDPTYADNMCSNSR
ncbi:uncharacterized protein LOC121969975 isoform X4 [Zingiber officinale]|uniref:uncharacterized protein LOC121969975 isoform X4 n=1 Tax=Zingiber officinale TaxID=94328 RepID=UPI001C4ABEB7|nr:uncharacterized protein LOC121969975 isoform X4 [Zingiber officinale]